jgi:hypothetical protein
MNLLQKYIPKYSGHVQGIVYDEKNETIEIVFFDHTEEFNPILKLIFEGVSNLSEEQLNEREENCIELVIGLDLTQSGYCLHTDLRELNFNASKVVSVELNV